MRSNSLGWRNILEGQCGQNQKMSLQTSHKRLKVPYRCLVFDEEIQAWNDKVPVMETDIEGQKAMALKDLAGLTARSSKCAIGTKTGQFLGHHVGDGVLGLDRDNLEKVE